MTLFDGNLNGAEFSDCGKFRFVLWRIWDESLPKVMFIGLNPSTANATNDDPTIRRVKGIAKELGFGGIYMLNLFPYITPYPSELVITGIEANDEYLLDHSRICGEIVFAWGAFPAAKGRAGDVIAMFPNAKALHINKDGSPKHPLYVPKATALIPFQ